MQYRRGALKGGRYKHEKIPSAVASLEGSAQTFFLLVLFTLFLSAGLYLFSVNQTAVQGYRIRELEKEISTLHDRNAELRITEADLRSLYRIQSSQESLQMTKIESIKYLESNHSVALR
ncbi:MAG: hypothetical protein WDN67_04430 [Candidatus Moraniibacteriota bacterium]